MKNIKSDTKKVARRHMSSISSIIFQELYEIFPKSVTLKSLAKSLDLREKTVKSTINKAITEGVPIEISLSTSNEVIYKADPSEPISYILKEKQSAEEMLKLIQSIPLNGNEEVNRKRNNKTTDSNPKTLILIDNATKKLNNIRNLFCLLIKNFKVK